MLSHLSIQNFVLIRKLEIDFHNGLSVITGETGTGKSIILGALALILGKRADSQVLFEKNKKCIIEGSFLIKNYGLKDFFEKNDIDYDEITILRREINLQGRARAFINDTPVNLLLLKELGDKLVNIHSQNIITTINDSDFQLAIIDGYAQHSDLLKLFKHNFKEFIQKKKSLNELKEKQNKAKAEQDYNTYLLNELESAAFSPDEQKEIETELEILNNSEEIKENLFKFTDAFKLNENNIITQLTEIELLLKKFSNVHPEIKKLAERMSSTLIELGDISDEVEKIEESISFEPERINNLSDRLDLIYKLLQKHKALNIKELLIIKESLSKKFFEIISLDEKITEINSEVEGKEKELREISAKISKNRLKAIPEIEKIVIQSLKELGIPEAQFLIEHKHKEQFTADGSDKVGFLFNANKGGIPGELSSIASGGELSRLMLSIKSLISKRNLLPTIIFDEIDSGVSGKIAGKVGIILTKMSKNMQVIVITHLPQIAGKGLTHYVVTKEIEGDFTKTNIQKIEKNERIAEIAKMLSGTDKSKSALETAKELLN
ncbi:MAG: DNA repair protein RecN [Bacteroidales bacterium]|nr:DNA repair protein RecN [Bacteroidales bacterium]